MNKAFSSLGFFWDIQNCPVPSRGSSYDCVTSIRAAVSSGERTTEVGFKAYCDIAKLSQETRQELSRARVNLCDVPSQKPGAADIRLLQDILHYTMHHRTGIIVLISGDIDFAETVHDLVHTGGYKVILIHNKQARPELCNNASEALSFEDIVKPFQQQGKEKPRGPDDARSFSKEANGKAMVKADDSRAKDKAPRDKDRAPRDKDKAPRDKDRAPRDKDKAPRDTDKAPRDKDAAPKDKAAKDKGVSRTGKKKVVVQQKVKQWTCAGCPKKFNSEEKRDAHASSTGHAAQWDCDTCGKLFESEKSLEQHQESTGHDQITCDDCGKTFNSVMSMDQHWESTGHCEDRVWPCSQCDDAFPRLRELNAHLTLDH
jgi:DNA-directed RNA polymerase subunit RPC12/RpoP